MLLDDHADAGDVALDDVDEANSDDTGEWLSGLRAAGLPVRTPTPQPRPPAFEIPSVFAELIEASWTPSTRAAYSASWRRFSLWCDLHGLDDPYRASPVDVATWIRSLVDRRLSPAYIARELAALRFEFDNAGITSPTMHVIVKRTVAGARRILGTAQHQAIPLRLDPLRTILTGMAIVANRPHNHPQVRRDRALLAIGFAAARRPSEIVALNVEDLTFDNRGVLVNVRRSKTDQEAAGYPIAVPYSKIETCCPVRAVMALARDRRTGPLFRSVDRHGRLGRRLAADSVSTIVRTHVRQVLQQDPTDYSGHSLRRGFVTEARHHNVANHLTMRQTGRKDPRSLERYDDPADLFDDAVKALEWM